MLTEISAGGVVYRKGSEGIQIQMIQDRFGKITLAKGKMEPGETIEQTALREIEEETGITGRIIEHLEKVTYQYTNTNGESVSKEVDYFLVEAVSGSLRTQIEEIDGVQWMTGEAAWSRQQTDGYRNNDSVLSKALKLLEMEH